jgi:hypothetical protein
LSVCFYDLRIKSKGDADRVMLISSQIDVMTIICQIVNCAFKQTEEGTTQKVEATRSLKRDYRDETVFIDIVFIFVS